MGSERPLVVATANVNGIRAAFRRGMGAWLAQARPDVLLLQEVRAPAQILLDHLGPEWHVVHHEAPAAGRAGVAIASRVPFQAVRLGLVGETADSVGRWVEADLIEPGGEPLTVISTYVHTATAQTPSMDVKLAFLDRATDRLGELRHRRVVVGGDLNVAHDQRDIKNWKGNRGKSGFLPQEQAYLSRWRDQGWVDAGRTHAGDVDGPYTWWSWRGRAYDNDAGWRIDYLWCSPALAGAVTEVTVDRAPSYDERWSDHAPVRAVLTP
ncbi:exodeoxyribonuclease III [Pseudactinotalea sp.]|uniref:exodeoxyribonuclease III n=1 Tax=Pseudactinotalea sp. TaxID=1926260 RepID=UPI003B3A5760